MTASTLSQRLAAWLDGQANLCSGNALPSIAISDPVIRAEGNTGTTAYDFTLTLSRNGYTGTIGYAWTVAGTGSAPASPTDFVATAGTGTFSPSDTTRTITVNVIGDPAVEPDETFTLEAVATIVLPGVSMAATIVNDDLAPSLIPIGELMADIGHSFIGNNFVGDLANPARPTIYMGAGCVSGLVASMLRSVRHDAYVAPNLIRLNLSGISGSFAVGDTVTIGGVTGTIQATSINGSSGGITLANVSGYVANGTATSGAGGSASAAVDIRSSTKGGSMGMAGDYLAPLKGFPGIRSRVPLMLGQQQKPRFLNISGAVNSLLQGTSAAQCVTETKAIVDEILAHSGSASAILLVHNVAALATGSGFNTTDLRNRICDYNVALRAALPGWAPTGRVHEVDAFSATIAGRTSFSDDIAAFRAGTRMGDTAKVPDNLHPLHAGGFSIATEVAAIVGPLVDPGDWWKARYGSRTNAIAGLNHAGTAGVVSSGSSVSMAGGSAGIVTGMVISGPSTASTVVCSLEAGTGANGAQPGEYIQVITYTKVATGEETITVQFATPNTGVALAGDQSWCQAYMPIAHDGADVFFGGSIQLTRGYNPLSTAFEYNSSGVQPSAKSIFSRAGARALITPPYKLDGTQSPSGSALRVAATFTAPAGRTGTQAIRIYPSTFLTVVDDPSAPRPM